MYDEKNPSIILCSRDLEEALNMKALHVTEIRYKKNCSSSCYYSWLTYNCTDDRDLVLSHLIMLADDEFLKEHCDSETPAPPPNYVSTSNQTSGMLAAW